MNDRNADWQYWFDRHGAVLVSFARQRTDCYADAEDVVQTAFVQFWKHLSSATDPLTYLYACVANAANNHHRSKSRQREREKKAWFVRANVEPDIDPDEIERAMATLPAEQREVVVLKIWEQLTFKGIAEVLAIPPNTAASRYRYAIAALKKLLPQGEIK